MIKRFVVAVICVLFLASAASADELAVGKIFKTQNMAPLVTDIRVLDMFTTSYASAVDPQSGNKPFWMALQEGLLTLRYVQLAVADSPVKVLEIRDVPAQYIAHSIYSDIKYVKIQYDAPDGTKVIAWTMSVGLKNVDHTLKKEAPAVQT